MRKIFIFIAALCLIVSVFQPVVYAANPYEFLPVDVVHYPHQTEIRKIYEMSASVDPARLPKDDFERDNILYKCTDILREVIISDETKPLTEVESVTSAKNDIESILRLLPMTKEVHTEDGFFGILYLNTSTIKSVISGYGSTSATVTVTRSYPNLSDRDSQYIPKTVTEGGITYTLTDIQWQTDNRYNVDDYEIGSRFTANATYSGTKTSSFVRGYNVTAEYSGELVRTGVSVVRYTVIFAGKKLNPPEPSTNPTEEPQEETPTEEPIEPTEPEPTETPGSEPTETETPTETPDEPGIVKKSGFNWAFVIIPLVLLALIAAAGAVYLYLNKRKESKNDDEEIDYDYTDIESDADTDDSDSDADDGSV